MCLLVNTFFLWALSQYTCDAAVESWRVVNVPGKNPVWKLPLFEIFPIELYKNCRFCRILLFQNQSLLFLIFHIQCHQMVVLYTAKLGHLWRRCPVWSACTNQLQPIWMKPSEYQETIWFTPGRMMLICSLHSMFYFLQTLWYNKLWTDSSKIFLFPNIWKTNKYIIQNFLQVCRWGINWRWSVGSKIWWIDPCQGHQSIQFPKARW